MRALVTGLGNVGVACAKHLLSQKWGVTAISRSPRGGAYIGAKLEFYPLNLCLDLDIANFLQSQAPFDLVIMAHGVQQPCELGKADTVDVFHSVMDGNLTSAFYLTNELIKGDRLNEGALVVYCSSIQATQPRRGRGCYAIAKAGLEALTRIVAVEQAPLGIRAVALRLGQLANEGEPATMRGVRFSPEQVEAIRERCPLPWVKTENIAKMCLSLYEQTEISGAVLDMESGHTLNIW